MPSHAVKKWLEWAWGGVAAVIVLVVLQVLGVSLSFNERLVIGGATGVLVAMHRSWRGHFQDTR